MYYISALAIITLFYSPSILRATCRQPQRLFLKLGEEQCMHKGNVSVNKNAQTMAPFSTPHPLPKRLRAVILTNCFLFNREGRACAQTCRKDAQTIASLFNLPPLMMVLTALTRNSPKLLKLGTFAFEMTEFSTFLSFKFLQFLFTMRKEQKKNYFNKGLDFEFLIQIVIHGSIARYTQV